MDLQGPSLQPGLPPPVGRPSSHPRLLPRPALGSRPPPRGSRPAGVPRASWARLADGTRVGGRGGAGEAGAGYLRCTAPRSRAGSAGQQQDRGVPARPAPGSPPLAAALPPPGPPCREVLAVVASPPGPWPAAAWPLVAMGTRRLGVGGGWAHRREAAAGAACGCSSSAETSPWSASSCPPLLSLCLLDR